MKQLVIMLLLAFAVDALAQNEPVTGNRKATVLLTDSTVISGAVIFESDTLLILKDEEGKVHSLHPSEIRNTKFESYRNKVNYVNQPAELILKDGSILRVQILKETTDSITFTTELTGIRTIERNRILELKYISDITSGSNQVYINLSSRYFYSPSAINMKKGDGYYQNIYVLINSVNYAITDHITIGAGLEAFSLLSGQPIFFIQTKGGIEVLKNLHAGIGYQHVNFAALGENISSFNLGFGTLTYGNLDYNISVNYGINMGASDAALITFSGFARVGNKFGLITENWIIDAEENVLFSSFGGRVIGRKNLFDFGIITNGDILSNGLIGIPYLSYTLRF